MKLKLTLMLAVATFLFGCASSAQKSAQWQKIDTKSTIICELGENMSGMLFLSNLGEVKTNTNMAPESIIAITATISDSNTFIVKKKLKRHIRSIDDYSTLSALDISADFEEADGKLVLTPLKKKEYQVSLVGEWPIPKMEPSELADYLGRTCKVYP